MAHSDSCDHRERDFSQEDPIMLRASIKRPLPIGPVAPIAISFPRWVPTRAALVQLYNCPPPGEVHTEVVPAEVFLQQIK